MEWDESFKGLVLSAFTYGYMSTQIIGGRMTEVYGVKKVRISLRLLIFFIIGQLSILSRINFVSGQFFSFVNCLFVADLWIEPVPDCDLHPPLAGGGQVEPDRLHCPQSFSGRS